MKRQKRGIEDTVLVREAAKTGIDDRHLTRFFVSKKTDHVYYLEKLLEPGYVRVNSNVPINLPRRPPQPTS